MFCPIFKMYMLNICELSTDLFYQIGTKEDPFLGEAIIELYGHVRATEIPIYGAKFIGVRNGTFEAHGKVNSSEH